MPPVRLHRVRGGRRFGRPPPARTLHAATPAWRSSASVDNVTCTERIVAGVGGDAVPVRSVQHRPRPIPPPRAAAGTSGFPERRGGPQGAGRGRLVPQRQNWHGGQEGAASNCPRTARPPRPHGAQDPARHVDHAGHRPGHDVFAGRPASPAATAGPGRAGGAAANVGSGGRRSCGGPARPGQNVSLALKPPGSGLFARVGSRK